MLCSSLSYQSISRLITYNSNKSFTLPDRNIQQKPELDEAEAIETAEVLFQAHGRLVDYG